MLNFLLNFGRSFFFHSHILCHFSYSSSLELNFLLNFGRRNAFLFCNLSLFSAHHLHAHTNLLRLALDLLLNLRNLLLLQLFHLLQRNLSFTNRLFHSSFQIFALRFKRFQKRLHCAHIPRRVLRHDLQTGHDESLSRAGDFRGGIEIIVHFYCRVSGIPGCFSHESGRLSAFAGGYGRVGCSCTQYRGSYGSCSGYQAHGCSHDGCSFDYVSGYAFFD